MRSARLLLVGWRLHFKMLSRSSFNSVLGIVYPLFFATVAFFMYREGSPHALLYASLGASVMGIWATTSTAAGGALQRERWHGTLELLVAAPAHFSLVMLPVTLAMSTIGVYSMAATLLWGRLVFGIELHIEHLFVFCVAVVVTIVAVGMCGFLLAVTFVRYRTAWALGNLLEYPVWLICGFLVPLSLLPGLGAAVLVGARADLGHARDPRGGTRRAGAHRTSGMCALLGAVYTRDRRPHRRTPARRGARAARPWR